MPAPKLFTTFPFSSNFRIVSMFLISLVVRPRQLFAPHRPATHTDLPSLSISTALVDPIFRPSGSLAHPSTTLYGLGASLVGATSCAKASTPATTNAPV